MDRIAALRHKRLLLVELNVDDGQAIEPENTNNHNKNHPDQAAHFNVAFERTVQILILETRICTETMSFTSRKIVQAAIRRRAASMLQQQQHRLHHPDPFNPKMTRGWKAALMVS